MSREWTWETASRSERGEWIRSHEMKLDRNHLKQLFCLTDEGMKAILDGSDWHPRFEIKP